MTGPAMTSPGIAVEGAAERERDRFDAARAVADATLYEGYLLYPYRASAVKNQLRWQFGVLTPRTWAETATSERWMLTTECLLAQDGPDAELHVRVRFLQLQRRTIEALAGREYVEVDSLLAGSACWSPWDEAVERTMDLPPLRIAWLGPTPSVLSFAVDAGTSFESIVGVDGVEVGRARRRWDQLNGTACVGAVPAGDDPDLRRLTVTVRNMASSLDAHADRDAALTRSLIGVHTLLALDGGSFVSLIDPPPSAADAAAGCRNDGTFPVLVADPFGGSDVVLSSPITLYDHPEVAPESKGDLYDATEIDEILALRVLTLTDEEKAEARGTDPRAAAIVDRCDELAPDDWARLHGTMRDIRSIRSPEVGPEPMTEAVPSMPPDATTDAGTPDVAPWWNPEADAAVDPWSDSVIVAGVLVAKGSRVVLRPNRRSDAHDLFLDGMAATVAGVFHDVDGTRQVAVTVDDDPATEVLTWQGRFLFFFPDEIEPRS